jgi:hypothetical protein
MEQRSNLWVSETMGTRASNGTKIKSMDKSKYRDQGLERDKDQIYEQVKVWEPGPQMGQRSNIWVSENMGTRALNRTKIKSMGQ